MSAAETFELFVLLTLLSIGLQWVALKLKLPPSAVLLVGGAALAFLPFLPSVTLDPGLALVLFLPPMLIDGAYYAALGRFKRQLLGILSLAVGAVVFTTLAVGLVVHWLVPSLPWAACFALGAIISPPDAVSARAILKGVTLPRRLTTLLEGESMLNDATGLILFRFAVAATLSGTFNMLDAAGSFAVVSLGGALVGLAVGFLWVFLVRRLQDPMLTISVTAVLCWVAYLAGEAVHVSGVIAVVVAGLVQGWHQHILLSAGVRLQGGAANRLIGFTLEAFVFILIGFSLRDMFDRIGGIQALSAETVWTMLAVVATVIVARFVWVFACDGLLATLRGAGLRTKPPMGWRQATVLSWIGMRGVVTLAIPLTLPLDMPGRDLMLICAFAVILATVVIQGASLGWLIRLVRPVDTEPTLPMDMPAAEAAIARRRLAAMEALAYDADGTLIHPQMLARHQERARFIEGYAADAQNVMITLQSSFDVMLESHAAGRTELVRLHRAGLIEDDVLHELERDLDVEEMQIRLQRGE